MRYLVMSVEYTRKVSNKMLIGAFIMLAASMISIVIIDDYADQRPDREYLAACDELKQQVGDLDIEECGHYLADNPESTGRDVLEYMEGIKKDDLSGTLDKKLLD